MRNRRFLNATQDLNGLQESPTAHESQIKLQNPTQNQNSSQNHIHDVIIDHPGISRFKGEQNDRKMNKLRDIRRKSRIGVHELKVETMHLPAQSEGIQNAENGTHTMKAQDVHRLRENRDYVSDTFQNVENGDRYQDVNYSLENNPNRQKSHLENAHIDLGSHSEDTSSTSTSSTIIYKSSISDEEYNMSSNSIGENSSDNLFESTFPSDIHENDYITDIHDNNYFAAPKEKEQVKVHRKILYEQQPFPDDYTGPSFLADIIENEDMIPYDYWLCVQETGAVTQQIALVGIFTCVFLFLQKNMISVWFACMCILGSLIFGYSILYRQVSNRSQTLKYITRSILIVVILFGTSPIMRTLTIEYSSDTIIALVVTLFIIHLYTHDYAFMNGYNSHFSCSLSLNSVFFISILLASQLPTSLHAFVIVSLSILLFALFPVLRHHLKVNSEFLISKATTEGDSTDNDYESFSYHILTILLCITAMVMLAFFSKFLVVLFGFLALFITFVIPYCLIILQTNYKYHVSGPWDEKKLPHYYIMSMD